MLVYTWALLSRFCWMVVQSQLLSAAPPTSLERLLRLFTFFFGAASIFSHEKKIRNRVRQSEQHAQLVEEKSRPKQKVKKQCTLL